MTTDLGAQGTVLAGGRYDRLVTVMGHPNPIPGVGWAAGLERLVLLSEAQVLPTPNTLVAVICTQSEAPEVTASGPAQALAVANFLRDAGLKVGSWLWLTPKKQLAKAVSLNATHAVFVSGTSEDANVTLKDLATREERQISLGELAAAIIEKGGDVKK